jgi:hypothetical protein
MKSEATRKAGDDYFDTDAARSSPAEFAAVIALVIVAVCAAAALLLSTPAALEAAPTSQRMEATSAGVAPRTFHERYPVNPTGDQVDAPTF